MIRDFIKEGTIYTLAGFLAKGISLLLIPVFTTYFSPGDYGVLDLLFVFSMFFNALFSFQIGQGLMRYLGESHFDQEKQRRLASTAFFFVVITYSLGALLVMIFRDPIMETLGLTHESYKKSYLLAVISIVLNGLFFFMSGHLQALRRKTEFAIASFLHALLGILGTYLFVIILDKSINGVFYATIAIVPVVLLYQFGRLHKEYRFKVSKKLLSELLKYSSPLIPAAIAYVLLSLTDRICINYYLDKEQLGIYSVGFKFSFAISLVISGFAMALGPLIYQRYKDEKTAKELAVLFNWFVVIGLFAVSTLTIFAEETVYIFTQLPYYAASDVLPMLYFSVWFAGLAMFSPGMNLQNKTKWIALVVIISAGLNIVLNIFFIPTLGIKGAAFATMLSSMINYGVLFILSMKLFKYATSKILLFTCLSFTFIVVAFTTSTRLVIYNGDHGVFIKVLLVVFLLVLLVLVIKKCSNLFFKNSSDDVVG